MEIFCKKWKKYNEIQLKKKQNELKYLKKDNHPNSPVLANGNKSSFMHNGCSQRITFYTFE